MIDSAHVQYCNVETLPTIPKKSVSLNSLGESYVLLGKKEEKINKMIPKTKLDRDLRLICVSF